MIWNFSVVFQVFVQTVYLRLSFTRVVIVVNTNNQHNKSTDSTQKWRITPITRGPKGHISCTWVQCATVLRNWPGRPFLFTDRPENTNLVDDIEILLLVKFRWIAFSSFRGEVENVSTNQRPGWPSCFSDRPDPHKLSRGCWYLASCQVSLNSLQQFQRRSRKCLSQSEARATILFSDRPEPHILRRGCWDIASCQVSLNSIQRFQRSRKCICQSEARAAILFFPSTRNTQIW